MSLKNKRLNKYLYLSGRVNMKEIEKTTQHLIADGFDIGTDRDPYKNFVYTSFQELATYISHNRVAKLAKDYGNKRLSKMCKIIAGDEMRHHHAYSEFVERIFTIDPSQMMMAFHYMMKQKITMPAHFLRESGGKIGTAFEEFSNTAQRIGVYTATDYVDILQKLIDRWDIGKITGLNEEAEKARDYLMKLPYQVQKTVILLLPMTPQEIIDKTIIFVKDTLANAEGGHDWFHIERVYRNSVLISKSESVDRLVVALGALLHDIADSKFNNGDDTIGPKIAKAFLLELHVDVTIM